MLERAEYVVDSDEIILYFAGEIDPIYEGEAICNNNDCTAITEPSPHISLRDGCCRGLGLDIMRTGGNQTSIIYEVIDLRDNLLAITDPWVRLYPESYTSISDGTVNSREEVPVAIVSQGKVVAPVRPDNLLRHAVYNADDNKLTLYFYEEINQFSIYVGRISVHDNSGSITLSVPEFVWVDADQKSIVFELSDHNRYGLSLMTDPVLRLKPGAVRSSAVGLEEGGDRMPLKVQGDLSTTLNPGISAGLLLGRAQYSIHDDPAKVDLLFREAIDPWSIDTSRITLVHDGCVGVVLSDQDSVQVSEDGKSAVIQMGSETSDILQSIPNIRIRLDQGAFATEADGTKNTAGDVPLIFLGKHTWYGSHPVEGPNIVRGIPCHLTYAVESPAEILEPYRLEPAVAAQYTKTVMLTVREGLEVWSRSNPHLTFELITDMAVANIVIELVNFDGELGYDYYNCLPVQCAIGVVIVGPGYVEDGSHKLVGYEHIMRVVAHEFGHNLGLGHHVSPEHLMFGGRPNDPILQDLFDDLEYNIPDLGRWPGY